MSDTMRDWYNKRFTNRNQELCEHGYEDMLEAWQAAQADARVLVGELRKAIKDAHFELNAIRARDGAPQHIDWWGGRPLQTSSCTHEWFNTVVEQCDAALTKAQAFMEGKV